MKSKTVRVSPEVYEALRKLLVPGQSMNVVVKGLLREHYEGGTLSWMGKNPNPSQGEKKGS